MATTSLTSPPNAAQLWSGRVISALPVAFMLFDGIGKVLNIAPVREAQAQLGYADSAAPILGALSLICVILYLIRRTSVLGAVMWSAYLGGAVAAQLRIAAPAFSLIFPVLIGGLAWLGLYLRDPRVRAVLPFMQSGR